MRKMCIGTTLAPVLVALAFVMWKYFSTIGEPTFMLALGVVAITTSISFCLEMANRLVPSDLSFLRVLVAGMLAASLLVQGYFFFPGWIEELHGAISILLGLATWYLTMKQLHVIKQLPFYH